MRSLIITQWIEPYKFLEGLKLYYSVNEYNFDGSNKSEIKEKVIKHIKKTDSMILYMKNVNKFYLFDNHREIIGNLMKEFNMTIADYLICDDENRPFDMIDMGKAEASLIVNKM